MHRHLALSSDRMSEAMRRLSSGLRIKSAADDAAGLGISERMRGQIRGLEQANRNIQDGISMLDTMEGVLDAVHSILQRAREIAVQFNNETNSFRDRQALSRELIALSNEIGRIEQTTNFNGIALMQNATAVVTLQVGANDGETVAISLVDLFGSGLNLVRSASFFTLPWLEADIGLLDVDIANVSQARARLGATSNRLEHARQANLTYQEQLMAAESRIRDADMAQELTTLVRQQILQQSTTTMLRLSNNSPARVLDLLKS